MKYFINSVFVILLLSGVLFLSPLLSQEERSSEVLLDRTGTVGKTDGEVEEVEVDTSGEVRLIGEDYTLKSDSSVYERITVIDGDVSIDGLVYEDISVIRGDILVNGYVYGNISVINGDLTVNGTVTGDVTVLGGLYKCDGIVTGRVVYDEEFQKLKKKGFIDKFFSDPIFEGVPKFLLWIAFFVGIVIIVIFIGYILARIGARYNRLKRETDVGGYSPFGEQVTFDEKDEDKKSDKNA